MIPSSAFRLFGHQPPCATPLASAHSSAALSTPVWPPEIILKRAVFISPVSALICAEACVQWRVPASLPLVKPAVAQGPSDDNFLGECDTLKAWRRRPQFD